MCTIQVLRHLHWHITIWITLIQCQVKVWANPSPWPEFAPEACKVPGNRIPDLPPLSFVRGQSNSDMFGLNTGITPSQTTGTDVGNDAVASEIPICGWVGSSAHRTDGEERKNQENQMAQMSLRIYPSCNSEAACSPQESPALRDNVLRDQAEPHVLGVHQSVTTVVSASGATLDRASKPQGHGNPANTDNSSPNFLVGNQVPNGAREMHPKKNSFSPSLETGQPERHLSGQRVKAGTEFCLEANTESAAFLTKDILLEQSFHSGQPRNDRTSSATIDHDTETFDDEFRKTSKLPGSGGPSLEHNNIPVSITLEQIIHSPLDGTGCSCTQNPQVDVPSKWPISIMITEGSTGAETPSTTIPSLSDSAGYNQQAKDGQRDKSYLPLHPNYLQVLSRTSTGPGSGSPSKGHNSDPDLYATE